MSTAGSTPPQVDRPGTGTRDTRSALRRYRSPLVVVGATTAVLGAIVLGGGSDDGDPEDETYDYDAVCVDATETRVEDERCDEETSRGTGGGAFWYFIAAGRLAPAIGGRATGGSRVAPDPGRFSVNTGGVDPRGGTVSRGGFGGRGGGGGDGSVGG